MNKKNIALILIGIFLVSVRFIFYFGHIGIDISHDVVGFLLIFVGSLGIAGRNSLLKKVRNLSAMAIGAACIGQAINCVDWGADAETFHSIAIALSVFFSIYISYYFTEGMIMDARVHEKEAVTRSFRQTWFVLAGAIFVHCIVFMSTITTVSIIVQAIIAILTIFYCTTVYNSCKQLIEE